MITLARLVVLAAMAVIVQTVELAAADRPGSDASPTPVEIVVFLSDVDDVDGADQRFVANVFYMLRWRDPRLATGSTGTRSLPVSDVWNPRAQFLNQQQVWKSFPDVVEVSPDGDVTYRQRVWGSFSQPLELRDFPFDRQTFEIQLVAVGYRPDDLAFVIDARSQIAEQFSLPDWDIKSWRIDAKPMVVIPDEPALAAVVFSFEATRRSEYFITTVILPLVLIVAMSWIVFWIDPKESGSQISVAITAMLTLIAYRFAIGRDLPKIEYMTRLDLFVLCSTFLVFATLVQVVVTSSLAKSDELHRARRIDLWCRWLFPALFLAVTLETLMLRWVD